MSTLVEQTKARKDYHAKWDAIATEEVQKVEDEDELDKQASSLSLGTDRGPKSEAEAKDKATNKALREAKALWEKRRDEERKQKLIIKGETKTVVVDPKLLGDALVVDIQECKKAVVTLIPGLKVAKVFVSQCEDVVVEVRCPLITSFVEVSRCTKTTLITSKVLHTVQCDLCDDCSIIWATKECFNEAQDPGSRVYSAACRRLGVAVGGRQDSLRVEVDNFDRSLCDKDTPIKEQQFVTQLVDGKLLTERIVQGTSKRLVGTTLRELEREGASSPKGLGRWLERIDPRRPPTPRVTRYEDDNRRVYKTIPMSLPPGRRWRADVNYSARTKDGRVVFDALPANAEGDYCAVLLLKAEDEPSLTQFHPNVFNAYLRDAPPEAYARYNNS